MRIHGGTSEETEAVTCFVCHHTSDVCFLHNRGRARAHAEGSVWPGCSSVHAAVPMNRAGTTPHWHTCEQHEHLWSQHNSRWGRVCVLRYCQIQGVHKQQSSDVHIHNILLRIAAYGEQPRKTTKETTLKPGGSLLLLKTDLNCVDIHNNNTTRASVRPKAHPPNT